jgi:hypothetical protein
MEIRSEYRSRIYSACLARNRCEDLTNSRCSNVMAFREANLIHRSVVRRCEPRHLWQPMNPSLGRRRRWRDEILCFMKWAGKVPEEEEEEDHKHSDYEESNFERV